MDKKMIYELIIEDESEGITNISFVQSPAVEYNFLMFNLEKPIKNTFSINNEERKEVTGVIMLADTPIYRRNEMGEHYVTFTKNTIKKIVLKYFNDQKTKNINLNHLINVNNIFLFESYIIDRDRGINPPNEFSDIPDGSWIGSFKVNNEEVWDLIKKGEYKGFSIEGFFGYNEPKDEKSEFEQIYKLLQKIK